MLEEEAKTKWCPLARQENYFPLYSGTPDGSGKGTRIGESGFACNRLDDGGGHTLCLGSQCMAWRWSGMKVHGYCGAFGADKRAPQSRYEVTFSGHPSTQTNEEPT